jgi:transcriptional regulator with XRE-family HTH domain
MGDISQDTTLPNAVVLDEPEKVLAARVRELRGVAGLTQAQLAGQMTAAGFSMVQSTIASIEAGHRPVRVNEAVALGDLLHASLMELLTPNRDAEIDRRRDEIRVAQTHVEMLRGEVEAYAAECAKAETLREQAGKRLEGARDALARLLVAYGRDYVMTNMEDQ